MDRHKNKTCTYNQNKFYVVFSALGSFFLPLVVMLYVYVKISRVIASRHKTLLNQPVRKVIFHILLNDTSPSMVLYFSHREKGNRTKCPLAKTVGILVDGRRDAKNVPFTHFQAHKQEKMITLASNMSHINRLPRRMRINLKAKCIDKHQGHIFPQQREGWFKTTYSFGRGCEYIYCFIYTFFRSEI